MKSKLIPMIAVCLLFNLFISCKKNDPIKVQRGFYYWKSNPYSLSEGELGVLKNLQVQNLYVKLFEVEKDEIFGTKPIAKTQVNIYDNPNVVLDRTMSAMNIVPTVFISNDVFTNSSKVNFDTLANNIVFLVIKYFNERINHDKGYNEIQIDCDWTIKTKDNYFHLLKAIKKISYKKLSCTLRLYPYKYPEQMGVPPVDKATLMCYNLLNPLENKDQNSIQNNDELEKYLKNVKTYPLHLDIALPVFSWMQVYQNNFFAGMIRSNSEKIIPHLKKIKPMWYQMQTDLETEEIYLRQGDMIKIEEVTEKGVKETISLLKKYLEFNNNTSINLFHLDEDNLKKYNREAILSFYTGFNN